MLKTGKKFSKPDLSRVINGDALSLAEKRKVNDREEPEKYRLDLLLQEQYPEYNRSSLQTFISSGFVTVNGVLAQKPNQKFPKTVALSLSVPEKLPLKTAPKTLFEDENVLVLDKPAGLLSMSKGEFCPEYTLEDFGLLVHRLDRDTSGVVILAKNEATQTFLRKQFQDRKTKKTYLAVVPGRPKLSEAKLDLPIARNLNRPTTFRVDPSGKPSVTSYRTLAETELLPARASLLGLATGTYSLLELKPETGRTHQLRVHLAYLSMPILGDPVYSDLKQYPAPRLFLHAKSLEISVPGEAHAERKTFTSELPSEFTKLFTGAC